ncbi:MAG TPA: hypothetical protein PK054_04245 [Anaerohalosphaeraceae bacterium]|nr:hypothetical protein [Anaerohalosphaeraceae bacterium]HOL87720.1 hypothetical protein [Anaerohalosphaeraceae bacterium]HPP55773.1 hypothetical protein [Anaerohalosphaeraceae bacterium]
MCKNQKTATVVIPLLIFSELAFSQNELSAVQLIRLMEASKARYVHMSATVTCRAYLIGQEQEKKELRTERTFIWKQAPNGCFADVRSTLASGRKNDQRIQYFFGIDYEKQIVQEANDIYGLIVQKGQIQAPLFYSVYQAIWGMASYSWERLWERVDTASVFYDASAKCYVYEFQIHGGTKSPWLRIWIDPAKDYVPVQYEILFPDKKMFAREQSFNWRKVQGLWVPMIYTSLIPNSSYTEYRVEQIEVNIPFDAKSLDIEFPEGLWVEDRIRRVEYRVPSKKSPLESSEQKTTGECQKVCLPPAATDEQLAEAALKAQQLLAQQTQTVEKQSPVISPEYVWIEPGRKEYVLTVEMDNAASGPVLGGHQFDGGGLVLHQLREQIADKGQIQLTIERPADMTGYGEGTLVLDLAGQKKTIYLIAPPLQQ